MDRDETLRVLDDLGVDARYVAVTPGKIYPLNPRRAKLTSSRIEELKAEGVRVVRSKVLEKISSRVHSTVTEHGLFQPKERVVLGLSGGKDSLTCALIMEPLSRRLGLEVKAVLVETRLQGEPVWGEEGSKICRDIADTLGFDFEYVKPEEDVGELAEENDESPCLICSLLRRRELRRFAPKIVLGHTLDDLVTTALVSAVKGEGFDVLSPVDELEGMRSDYVDFDFPPTTVVRPLLRVPEVWTERVPEETGLPVFEADCPYSKRYATTLRGRVHHALEWMALEVGIDREELLDRFHASLEKGTG